MWCSQGARVRIRGHKPTLISLTDVFSVYSRWPRRNRPETPRFFKDRLASAESTAAHSIMRNRGARVAAIGGSREGETLGT